MKIGLDFDRVLFDTDSFDDFYKENTRLFHVDADVYDEFGDYDPSKHAKECGIDPETVYSIFEEDLSRFLYDDIDFLKKLKEEHTLIIVTRGNKRFQKAKIEASSILDYVDNFVIVEGERKDIADIEFLVDDREEEINSVDVPGMVFKREKHKLKDILDRIK